jgi:hypothetical protein
MPAWPVDYAASHFVCAVRFRVIEHKTRMVASRRVYADRQVKMLTTSGPLLTGFSILVHRHHFAAAAALVLV